MSHFFVFSTDERKKSASVWAKKKQCLFLTWNDYKKKKINKSNEIQHQRWRVNYFLYESLDPSENS